MDTFSIPALGPILGLIAFVLMWLHIISAPFRPFLERHFSYQKFISRTSLVVLFCLVFHPALILSGILATTGWPGAVKFVAENYLVWLAIVSWLIFIAYDIAKKFRQNHFLSRHWQAVRFIATLPFFLILIHSLGLGEHLQSGPLRALWLFFGLTAAISAFYTYIFRLFRPTV